MTATLWEYDLNKPTTQKEILKSLVISAHLAPSSHNTQPWRFEIAEDSIEVYADFKRRLLVADPTDKELYISCGCAVSNIEVSCAAYEFEPDIVIHEANNQGKIATIKLQTGNPDSTLAPLHAYITQRCTNRSLYQTDKPVPTNLLEECQQLIESLPVKIHFFTGRDDIEKLAQLNKDGIFEALSNPEFRNELSHWVRHNWTKKGDGLTGDTMGLPNAMSIIAPVMVRSEHIATESSQDEEKMILSAPVCGLVSAAEDSVIHWVNVGRAYERIALKLTEHSVSTALLTAAIEMPSQKQKLTELLHNNQVPQLFFRLGYPTKQMPHAPRRPFNQIATWK